MKLVGRNFRKIRERSTRSVNKACGSFDCETAFTYRAVKLIMWLVYI
jgi:hypothetical protein